MHLFNHLEPSLQFHCAGVRLFLETAQQFALHAIERVLPWTFRISSGVSKRIDKSVVQSDREFLNVGVGGSTLYNQAA